MIGGGVVGGGVAIVAGDAGGCTGCSGIGGVEAAGCPEGVMFSGAGVGLGVG